MSLQPVTIQAGNYAIKDIPHSEDADFVWPLEFYEGSGTTTPSVLTGRTFSFEVLDVTGASLGVYEIGTGITVASNVVTVTIELEDWAAWTKNCDLRYEFKQVLSTGIRYPLFKGKFRLTT
jgi:hypothetical protein